MNEIIELIEDFEETLESLHENVALAMNDDRVRHSRFYDEYTYTQMDEAIEDNPYLLDHGIYAEGLYLRKIDEGLDGCTERLRSGSFHDLEDTLESLSSYVVHLEDSRRFRLHLEILQNITEILTEKIGSVERYTEREPIKPEIILGVSDELMRYAKEPKALFDVDPRHFEEIIAEIFAKFGLEVSLTKTTWDGGYDIFALEKREFAENKYIVECKRYARQKKVGIGLVRQLYAVKIAERFTKAFLVTTSSFTRQAIEFQRQHSWEMELKDFHDIETWLQQHWLER